MKHSRYLPLERLVAQSSTQAIFKQNPRRSLHYPQNGDFGMFPDLGRKHFAGIRRDPIDWRYQPNDPNKKTGKIDFLNISDIEGACSSLQSPGMKNLSKAKYFRQLNNKQNKETKNYKDSLDQQISNYFPLKNEKSENCEQNRHNFKIVNLNKKYYNEINNTFDHSYSQINSSDCYTSLITTKRNNQNQIH